MLAPAVVIGALDEAATKTDAEVYQCAKKSILKTPEEFPSILFYRNLRIQQ